MADFQQHLQEFEQRRVGILAMSVDPLEEARKTAARHQLTFPLAYGVDGPAFASATGAFFDATRGYIHATGFILGPDGAVSQAVYSTGPVGRYVAKDVIGLLDYLSKHS